MITPRALLIGIAATLLTQSAFAQTEKSAVVSNKKGTVAVGLGKPPAPEREAALKERVTQKDYLRTGAASLAELEFTDASLTRVGPLSVFRFAPESSNFILEKGEGLFVFPKGKGGSAVSTPSFAAGILGTTVYVKATRSSLEYSCLEGRCRIGPHILTPGEKLVIRGSRQAYTAPKQHFDIARFLQDNPLIAGFENKLPSLPLIEAEASRQQ
ncbi:MAG: FecR family protein [Verrucomicrobiota bacterium]